MDDPKAMLKGHKGLSPYGPGLQRDSWVLNTRNSLTLPVATPLCHYRIAYRFEVRCEPRVIR